MRRIRIRNGFAFFPASPYPVFLFILVVNLFVMLDGQTSNDEGIWNYIARVWCENRIPPYLGTIENKTPGIFELFAGSYLFFGVDYYFVYDVARNRGAALAVEMERIIELESSSKGPAT